MSDQPIGVFLGAALPRTVGIAEEDIDICRYSVLRLCGFNEDPQAYMPARRKKSIFAKGEELRLIRQVLGSRLVVKGGFEPEALGQSIRSIRTSP